MRTPAENEAFVRERWDAAEFRTGSGYDGRQGIEPEPPPTYWFVRIVSKSGWEEDLYFSRLTLSEAWAATAEFTEQRLKEAHQAESSIAWVEVAVRADSQDDSPSNVPEPAWIISSLRERLAELKKGMRA